MKEERKIISVFPGNKADYESLVGYKVKIVDTGNSNKSLFVTGSTHLDAEFLLDRRASKDKKLSGVEAIINAVFIIPPIYAMSDCTFDNVRNSSLICYGLPVEKID